MVRKALLVILASLRGRGEAAETGDVADGGDEEGSKRRKTVSPL
jgi:hypothetical protein